MYLSITGATPDNKLAKYQPFNTQAEAEAHATEYNGFAIQDPEGNQDYWVVDMVAKTVTIDTVSEDADKAELALTKYARDRKQAYDALNQFEMQFDDNANGTTTWVDAINAIKAKYPKPE